MIQSGGYSPGVPPLPIPNREVKPRRADGTAPQCGRVGRRLFLKQQSFRRNPRETAFFVSVDVKFFVLFAANSINMCICSVENR